MITKTKIANKMATPPSVPPTMAPVAVCFECAMASTGELPGVMEEELEVDVGLEVPLVGPPFIAGPAAGALELEFVGMAVERMCGAATLETLAKPDVGGGAGGLGGMGWVNPVVVVGGIRTTGFEGVVALQKEKTDCVLFKKIN